MNSLQELIQHGINEHTARRMLADYQKRIGTTNGIYKIMDIKYDFAIKAKDVTLKCTSCGKIIHRTMIKGRNKWSELIKSCECQKELVKISEKSKKERILAEKGNIYGDYVVTDVLFEPKIKLIMNCLTCGAEIRVSHNMVSSGRWKDKKCHKHSVSPEEYNESLIGKKNNYLTIVGITRDNTNRKILVCQCDCGNPTMTQPYHWKTGIVKSCGRMSSELLRQANSVLEHTDELNRLRRIYNGMKQRCYNYNNDNYPNYGGRGIRICEEWLSDRETFITWALTHGYSNQLSIDRIEVNGNYEPSNCRWATDKEQKNNQRPRSETGVKKQIYFEICGVELPAREWCEKYGVSYETVMYRIKKKGMTPYEALTSVKLTNGRPKKGKIVICD